MPICFIFVADNGCYQNSKEILEYWVILGMVGRTACCFPGVAEHLPAQGKKGINSFAFVLLNCISVCEFLISHASPSSWCQLMEVGQRRELEPAGANPSQQSCSGHSLHSDVGLDTPVIFLTAACVGVKLLQTIHVYFLKKKLLQTMFLPPLIVPQAEGYRSDWCWRQCSLWWQKGDSPVLSLKACGIWAVWLQQCSALQLKARPKGENNSSWLLQHFTPQWSSPVLRAGIWLKASKSETSFQLCRVAGGLPHTRTG